MADDKGTSQLFGESLPGTSGDYLDTNDVEGHMANKNITPTPPTNDGGADDFNNKPLIPGIEGSDTEGHRKGPGGNIPNADGGDGSPDGFNNKPLIPGADGSDTEGHRKGPGGNIPNVDGSPDDFSNKRLFRDFDGGTDEDVEGHGFAKRAPGENPHGDR